MHHRSPLFGGTPGLEPVALRIARINEDLSELQDMLEVAMRDMDSQQAEAALELQRLRARLLDGLCPAKLRQSERVKRLAKRLARLEQNVGREQTECVRVMEAVLSTVERNGAVAEAVCQHLGTRRALGHGYQDEVRERGLQPSAPVIEDYPDQTLQALRAEPSRYRKSQVIDERQGDAGAIIEEAMQAMQKMLASLERHTDEATREDSQGFPEQTDVPHQAGYCHADYAGGTLSDGRSMAGMQRVVQPSLADAEPVEDAKHEHVEASDGTGGFQPERAIEGVKKTKEADPSGADNLQTVPAIAAFSSNEGSEDVITPAPRGSEEVTPAPRGSEEVTPAPRGQVPLETSSGGVTDGDRRAPIVEVRRLSSQEGSEEGSSSGSSPAENLVVKRVTSSDAGSSSSGSGVIEHD